MERLLLCWLLFMCVCVLVMLVANGVVLSLYSENSRAKIISALQVCVCVCVCVYVCCKHNKTKRARVYVCVCARGGVRCTAAGQCRAGRGGLEEWWRWPLHGLAGSGAQ